MVVVDNDSHDDSLAVMAPFEQRGVRVVPNATNRGFAGGANDGIAVCDTPFVLVSNFDVRPARDFVAKALAAFGDDPRVGAIQGKLIRFTQAPGGGDVIDTTGHVAFVTRLFRNRGEGEVDRGQWDTPGEVFGVSGALALYRREMLDDVALTVGRSRPQPFDEDLFAFFEDVDLDWRCQLRGWKALYEPAAVARHERGGAGVRRTAKVERLNFVNRWFVIAHSDDLGSLARAMPAFGTASLLKSVELLVTVPSAFFGAMKDLPRLRSALRTRREVLGRATVDPASVVEEWFEPFDWSGWIRTWWRRVRGVPVGTE